MNAQSIFILLSGKLVDTIEHSSTISDGQESWDLSFKGWNGHCISEFMFFMLMLRDIGQKDWKVCDNKMMKIKNI